MKKVLSALLFVLALGAQLLSAEAQTNNVRAATRVENDGKGAQQQPATSSTTAAALPLAPAAPNSGDTSITTDAPSMAGATTAAPGAAASQPAGAGAANASAANGSANALTSIYKVGVGDVLDIRLLNSGTSESTLYTVLEGGLLEYPLAGDPVQVAGLTTDEIDESLTSKVKVYDKPEVVVSVRQYASHNVIVTGLVQDPGTKALRREAVPLYVVLTEAQPRHEAGQATIMRAGQAALKIDLADSAATSTLVYPGDVITLTAPAPKPPQFYFIGGHINSPGQKDFHAGLTLTQAILASGGPSRFAGNKVKIMRQGEDGRLVTTEYNLKQIEQGKVPDPQLQPGDRLEMTRGGW